MAKCRPFGATLPTALGVEENKPLTLCVSTLVARRRPLIKHNNDKSRLEVRRWLQNM